jgi:hypothetical protein
MQKAVIAVAALVLAPACVTHHQEPVRPSSIGYSGTIGGGPHAESTDEEETATAPRLVRPGAPSAAASNDALHAKYPLGVGGGPRPVETPTSELPAPPATIDSPAQTGADAALRGVPQQAPQGHLGRDQLEGPLRDAQRFARCAIPTATRLQIDAVVYNGQAVGVDVRATPKDAALEFCVEQVVRETSWVKELAVNRVSVTL